MVGDKTLSGKDKIAYPVHGLLAVGLFAVGQFAVKKMVSFG